MEKFEDRLAKFQRRVTRRHGEKVRLACDAIIGDMECPSEFVDMAVLGQALQQLHGNAFSQSIKFNSTKFNSDPDYNRNVRESNE